MGDPKKLKKKYSTPAHPWEKTAIEEGKALREEYGLKNRREILVATSFLKKYKNIAKKLIADQTAQGEKEKKQMMDKLQGLGLLTAGAELDDVLGLELRDILNRRIQSLVFRKGLARSTKQARQFIVHRHVVIDDKEITSPCVLVSTEDENKLGFKQRSGLSNEDHPERISLVKEVKEEKGKTIKPEGKEQAGKDEKKVKEEKKETKEKEVLKETKKEEKPEMQEETPKNKEAEEKESKK